MIDLSATAHLWIKALHIISIIAWMAGLLYLPRLFVYHAGAAPGTGPSETFKVMERRLLRAIMNPAMVATLVTGGLLLANLESGDWGAGWLQGKLAGVVVLFVMHGLMAHWRRAFDEDRNPHSERFYRFANEIPTVLMVAIVVLAVVRPF